MSTKINIRSPYFLAYTEPSIPTPVFDCFIANPRNFTINQQGIITLPSLDFGVITAQNADKYATVSSPTSRTLAITIQIPVGFSNTDTVGFISCNVIATQPAFVNGTTCTTTVTKDGNIPAKTITVGGNSLTINLASFFTGGTIAGFNIINEHRNLVTTSLSSSTLTLTSNQIGGTKTIFVEAFDNTANTCTAVQSIAVTVNGLSTAFNCTIANLAGGGGGVSQAGVITNPQSIAAITGISLTSGGSLITSVAANTGSSAQNVTLFFKLTAPVGYTNAGAVIFCSKVFAQQATNTLPAFTCDIANLTGQAITTKGAINVGTTQTGTITDFTPISFASVTTATERSVTYTVLIPSGYSNTGNGSQTISCAKTLTQPAGLADCGTNTYYISAGKVSPTDFCDDTYTTSKELLSTGSTINEGLGATSCIKGAPFAGKDLYYAVSTSSINSGAGIGVGTFKVWQIDNNGVITDVSIVGCDTGGGGSVSNL
tara:strand:+ start:421 stop:1878 length:1458 start_codon:yes stop_codon:yes gene_type:complete